MLINPYYLSLIGDPSDPIGKQVIPDAEEICDQQATDDPLDEASQSPLPGMIHRYPDRVVFIASNQCPIHCRFCLRKGRIGQNESVCLDEFGAYAAYIQNRQQIKEVILSGGDPLLLSTSVLNQLLTNIRKIRHIEIIRIHTRVPCALPQRVTDSLVGMLAAHSPLYINTHFNHPAEITPQSAKACGRLTDGGMPVGCQTVLLKGVNDESDTMKRLMGKLLSIRVRPYFVHQLDRTRGTCHFRTPLQKGLAIIDSLRGHTSGIGVPQYMIDLPGGGGKVPLLPEYVLGKTSEKWTIRNYTGKTYEYPIP